MGGLRRATRGRNKSAGTSEGWGCIVKRSEGNRMLQIQMGAVC